MSHNRKDIDVIKGVSTLLTLIRIGPGMKTAMPRPELQLWRLLSLILFTLHRGKVSPFHRQYQSNNVVANRVEISCGVANHIPNRCLSGAPRATQTPCGQCLARCSGCGKGPERIKVIAIISPSDVSGRGAVVH